jgi:hypothetical protein
MENNPNALLKEPEQIILTDNFRKQDDYTKIVHHKTNISRLKSRLGKKCSYLSWQRTGDQYGIKSVIDNNTIEVALGGTPDDVGYEEYENLFNKLNIYGKEN